MTTKNPSQVKNEEKRETRTKNDVLFPVVGIGASAGGLEAFEAFVKALPEDLGIAYVLVVHLDPSHASILPEIIQKKTRMKVCQITDNTEIVPDQIFIIPPNKDLAIINNTLQLLDMKKPRGTNLPIDTFFRSLAQDRGSMATGIILSGTGSDGTLGVRAIKGEAGLVMVQDLQSAKYDGMPRSAIASGLADYVLPPEKMPEQLSNYAERLARREKGVTRPGDENMLQALQKIYALLRTATNHDFSLYKKNTICRRIERRMQVQQIDNIDDYVRYLQESDTETATLFRELLIGVTSFFRDPVPFELLRDRYLPELLKDKPDEYRIRIWVPGCSSGEEAYSIAIIVWECMEILGRSFEVQIFGTDLDENAINVARVGRYPDSIAVDVSEERLKRFFTKEESYYQINKNIREMVVFAPQNIIKDPPFTRLDLVSCRNLLIYFGQKLQNQLLPIFRYSLKEDGLLFLGSSETISQTTDLFTVCDKKWKIFKCRPSGREAPPALYYPTAEPVLQLVEKEACVRGQDKENNTARLLKVILAQSNLPPSVVIDDSANIIYVHGRTGRFLEPAEGETSANIVKMARPGLQGDLARAIRRMSADRQEIKISRLRINDNGGYVEVNLTLRPLPDFQTGQHRLTMVMFDEIAAANGKKDNGAPDSIEVEKRDEVKKLEDILQTTIEEMETANEELKSTNEELQSTNEELQSTNEELETSKEEMQSLNEETTTVNAELQSRIDELIAANDDIKNLLDATEIATIFLDIELTVRRYTPKATELFHLTASDVGRPIMHFATSLVNVRLVEYAEKVLTDLSQHESEVGDEKGNSYRMRVRPYRTINNVIDGVVVTFEDISKYKELMGALTESESLWRGLVENAPMGVFIMTSGRFAYLNPGALKIFGASSLEEIVDKPVIERVHPDFHDLLGRQTEILIEKRQPVAAIEEKWLRMDGASTELVVSAAPILFKKQRSALVFVREEL